jgi:hypothetical protein
VLVCDTDTSRIVAEFLHGDRLHDHRTSRSPQSASLGRLRILAGEPFFEDAVTQWRRENGVDPITGELA